MTSVSREAPASIGFAVILGLSMGSVVALGYARFAYALLLPGMRADLGWSYAQAGTLNTIYSAGYVLGALASATFSARLGTGRAFLLGLSVTALTLLACGVTSDFAALVVLRALAGFSSAVCFIVGAVLSAQAGVGQPPARQTRLIALYFGGGGTGMIASSVTVPTVLALDGGWRGGWIVLGVLAVVAIPLARHAALSIRGADTRTPAGAPRIVPYVRLWPMFTAYFLYGAGYIGYMTFIIAFLRGEGADDLQIAGFWAALGVASMVAGFVWGRFLAWLPGGWPMAMILLVNAAGVALPLLSTSVPAIALSALLFGATVMAPPSAGTAFVRKAVPALGWASVLGRMTFLFGSGQTLGPILAGVLADTAASGIRAGLVMSIVILVTGAGLSALQPEPPPQPS